jgi:hypothetical protein
MSRNITRRLLLLAGVAALAATPSVAGSQAPVKPPVVKKLPIVKEKTAAGEVSLLPLVCIEPTAAPVAAIDITREAAIRAEQARLDSVMFAQERDLIESRMLRRLATARFQARENMRRETENDRIAEENARRLRLSSRGIYLGIGGGSSSPMRYVRDSYTGGYNVTIPAGYDATSFPLGYRFDLSVDHLNGTRVLDANANTIGANGDITVWSLNFDLKPRIQAPGTQRAHLYGLAGVGIHRVSGGVYGTSGELMGNTLDFSKTGLKAGWNAGAGASFAWGPAELFVESRFMQVKTDYHFRAHGGLGKYTSFTPLVVGLTWF